jgi:hypothetical protein
MKKSDPNAYSIHVMHELNLLKNKRGNVRINVTLRCVRVTTVAVEKQWVFNIMSVRLNSYLSYPTTKSHFLCAASYCHVGSVWPYCTFPHYLINDTIFREKNVRSSVYDCTVTSWCRITSCNIHEPAGLDDIARADDMRERRCTTLHHAVTCCPSSPKPKP